MAFSSNSNPNNERVAGTLAVWTPAYLIATWFGSGNLPVAPGTWGSAIAAVMAWFIVSLWGPVWLLLATLFVIAVGTWAAEVYCRHSSKSDPGPIVVDEVAGQWITLLVIPADIAFYVAGFFLFRLADILKPWPASWADRSLPGGFGVMIDDLIAGVYSALILLLLWSLGAAY